MKEQKKELYLTQITDPDLGRQKRSKEQTIVHEELSG
jgi:hypothetical protein